jgi:hypothetical protein
MLLHTPAYLLFLAAVAAITWALPGQRGRKPALLAASYIFYALFDLRFAGPCSSDGDRLLTGTSRRACPAAGHG